MNVEIENRRRVRTDARGFEAPTAGQARDSMYAAERSGLSELAKARSRIGETLADCGKMLVQYDQHVVKKEYAADMRMLKVRFAGEYANMTRELSEDPSITTSEQFKAAFASRSADIRERVLKAARNGDADGFTFRNMDRWTEEIDMTANIQEAEAMTQATERWIAARENMTKRVNDMRLATEVQTGTSASVTALIDAIKQENPNESALWDAKRELALYSVEKREAANMGVAAVNAFDSGVPALLEEAGRAVAKMREEPERVNIGEISVPGEGASEAERDAYRAKVAAAVRKNNADDERRRKQEEEAVLNAYHERGEELVKRQVEAYAAEVNKFPHIDAAAKDGLVRSFESKVRASLSSGWALFKKANADKVRERNVGMTEAMVEARRLRDYSTLAVNPDFQLIAPTDASIPDAGALSAFRFLRVSETGGELGDAEKLRQSTKTLAVGLARLSSLDKSSGTFAEDCRTVLMDAKLRGITREDYATLWEEFGMRCTGERDNASASYFKKALIGALASRGIIKPDVKFDDYVASESTNAEADAFLAEVITTAGELKSFESAQHYIDNAVKEYAKREQGAAFSRAGAEFLRGGWGVSLTGAVRAAGVGGEGVLRAISDAREREQRAAEAAQQRKEKEEAQRKERERDLLGRYLRRGPSQKF